MPDEVTLESLRQDIGKLRQELVDARIDRATRVMENMRNWMAFYTPFVSGLFLLFAFLGWRGLSDIQTNKDKFEALATQADKLLTDVNGRFDLMSKDVNRRFAALDQAEKQFKTLLQDNQKIVQQNKTVLQGFRSSIRELKAGRTSSDGDADAGTTPWSFK